MSKREDGSLSAASSSSLCSCVIIIYLFGWSSSSGNPFFISCLSNKHRFVSKIYELMSERLILRVDENVNNQSWGTIKNFMSQCVMRKSFTPEPKSLQQCVMYLWYFLSRSRVFIKIYLNAGFFFVARRHGMQLYIAKLCLLTHKRTLEFMWQWQIF